MNLRDQLQEKWAAEIYSTNTKGLGIAHICPRGGKIRTSIRFFEMVKHQWRTKKLKVLICYPDKNIQQSWENDFLATGYDTTDVSYTTHMSLKREKGSNYDVIICDEIHLLSAAQKLELKRLISEKPDYVIGLSGTMSEKTELELRQELKMPVVVEYSLAEAIRDGLISDYRIHVLKTELDDTIIVDPKKKKTEKQKYKAISWVIKSKGQSLFLSLARMRIIHNSLAKINITKKLLLKLKDQRVLVFVANNKVAKALNCTVHTTKYNNQDKFDQFTDNTSKHKHQAVCKIGNTGLSFKSLAHIVVNAFDSNSENLTQRICRSLILDEKDKVSNIYIVSSTEEAELKWLEKSLEFFDKSKIKYY